MNGNTVEMAKCLICCFYWQLIQHFQAYYHHRVCGCYFIIRVQVSSFCVSQMRILNLGQICLKMFFYLSYFLQFFKGVLVDFIRILFMNVIQSLNVVLLHFGQTTQFFGLLQIHSNLGLLCLSKRTLMFLLQTVIFCKKPDDTCN